MKVGSERGLNMLSRVVEEAIEEEVSELLVVRALEEMLGSGREVPLTIVPVKLRVTTDAGRVVREMRDSRP